MHFQKTEIKIPFGRIHIEALLYMPEKPKGIILFAHGSGSSRFSPRNNLVAGKLAEAGFASLLLDLLTIQEESDRANVFDIVLLTERLVEATQYVLENKELKTLPIGYFGASTGAAAALEAAATLKEVVRAVVSRGGRPDLAMHVLPEVKSPTLLIVGSLDTEVIVLNEQAYGALHCVKKIYSVKGAEHLFEGPGQLEEVAEEAIAWYTKYI